MRDMNTTPNSHPETADTTQDSGRDVGRQRMAVRLAEIEMRSEELQRAIRNALGESEYARHRAESDLAHAYKFAIEIFAKALLPFKDTLEAALKIDTSDANALKAGLALSLKQLDNAFQRNGLLEICPHPGERFDAERHRSVSVGSRIGERERIASTERKGYELNGRVIRPAAVMLRREK